MPAKWVRIFSKPDLGSYEHIENVFTRSPKKKVSNPIFFAKFKMALPWRDMGIQTFFLWEITPKKIFPP